MSLTVKTCIQLWLFCVVLMFLSGCRDKPIREAIERPVLFTEIVDQQSDLHGRFAGSIQPQYEVALGFRIPGRIATRHAETGQMVHKGDLLATLEPSDQQNRLRAQQAELSKAQAAWQQTRDEQLRYQQLFERGVGSRAHLDRLSSDLRSQEAILHQARIASEQAGDHLSYTRLLAEFDGVVTEWHAEVGQVMVTGHAVVSLARPESREAVVDLPVELAANLDRHMQIKVVSQLNDKVFVTAQVRQLSPQIDATTRTQRVRLALNEIPDSFRLGSTVSIEISSNVPSFRELPDTALLERDGQAQVWVIDPQTATLNPRTVQVLARHGSSVRVSGALNDGERVVIAGVNSLKAGQKIRVEREVSL